MHAVNSKPWTVVMPDGSSHQRPSRERALRFALYIVAHRGGTHVLEVGRTITVMSATYDQEKKVANG